MKTTVDLPPELLRRLKAEAALEGRSMKELLIEVLRQRLLGKKPASPAGWRSVFGRATPAQVRDVELRLADLEHVDLEDWK